MGAILAILGDSTNPENHWRMERMIVRSPYRGAAEQQITEGLILATMSMGWDASLGSWKDWLVAIQGYITNWDDLAALHSLDFDPSSNSADKIAQAYESMGNSLFGKLRGEFAVLLYNRRSRHLIALTSPVGTRPLFFKQEKDRFIFATEIRQILAPTGEKPVLNEAAMVNVILKRAIPSEETVYVGISRILPARVYTFSQAQEVAPKGVSYWKPPETSYEPHRSQDQYVEELRHHMKKAVERALPPVPFGLGLSGGLDSGAILAFLRELAREGNSLASECANISVVFPGFDCDESERIQATLTKTETTAEIVNGLYFATDWFDEDLEALDLTTDPGIHDFKVITEPLQMTQKKVLFTGTGGDEWLTGDLRYLADDLRSFRLLSIIRDFIHLWRGSQVTLPRFIWRNIIALNRPFPHRKEGTPSDWLGHKWRSFYRLGDVVGGGGFGEKTPPRGSTLIRRILHITQLTDLHPQIEQFVARQGVELRHPFMDLDLVEFGFRIPSRELIARRGRKELMRKALDACLPKKVLHGRKSNRDCLAARDAERAIISPVTSWSLVRRDILDLEGLTRLETSRRTDQRSAARLFELWWFENFCRRFLE